MERIINRILEAMDRSKVYAEILRLPNAYTDGRGPPVVVRAVEEIHRTMDVVEIVSQRIEYLDELLEELQREIHLLRNSL